MTGRRLRAGFTLIEVLIALSVLAVTMTAVFTMFSSGLKLRTATRERLGFDRDSRLLLTALSDDLANLMPCGPAPLVGDDSIVLWRKPGSSGPGRSGDGRPLLVTYQWSGSATQDSLLVRLTTPLVVDYADSALVYQEFMKWARGPVGLQTIRPLLLRQDDAERFGDSAILNRLSGSWVAFPGVRDFRLEVPRDITSLEMQTVATRLVVRVGSAAADEALKQARLRHQDDGAAPAGQNLQTVYLVPGGLGAAVMNPELLDEGGAS